MRKTIIALCSLALLASCKSDSKSADKKTNAKTVVDPNPVVIETPPAPKEHSSGMDKFKDPGIYVDGVPIAVLKFGEMPVPLAPTWIEERAAIPYTKDTPKFKVIQERRYKFVDYFKALGIDVSTIKEMHLYGGNKHAAAVVIPGDQLRKSEGFMFRFGGAIWGKPLPNCPGDVGDGKCPDQLSAVALYIDKVPPVRKGGYFYFGEERVKGIPYYGEALRGGVRVYLDGPMVAVVKRNKLKTTKLEPVGDPSLNKYSLIAFLKSQKVDTSKVQEAWLIAYDRRIKKLTRADLLKATFSAGESGSGEILVGATNTAAHAIALHTKPLSKEDMPVFLPEELDRTDG